MNWPLNCLPNTKNEINAYFDGIREGVMMFAPWKDGIQYVGTWGQTLNEAMNSIERMRQMALENCRVKAEPVTGEKRCVKS